MADNDVLKLLDRCADTAYNCGSVQVSKADMLEIHDFVCRQVAEIEHWKGVAKLWHTMMKREIFRQDIIRADAIEAFAERVKMEFYYEFDELIPSIMADKIDALVKEMVGDTDG